MNALCQCTCELANLGSGLAFTPVHPQRQPDDERANPPKLNELRDSLDGISFALVQRLHRMSKNAKIIGSGDTDPGIAMIDA